MKALHRSLNPFISKQSIEKNSNCFQTARVRETFLKLSLLQLPNFYETARDQNRVGVIRVWKKSICEELYAEGEITVIRPKARREWSFLRDKPPGIQGH